MKLIIQAISGLIILIGLALIIIPEIIFAWMEELIVLPSFYFFVIAFRFGLGLLFVLMANESKFPRVMKVLGYLSMIAAIVFTFLGHERLQDFLSSIFVPAFTPYAPISGVIAVIAGAFLLYAFSGRATHEES